MHHDTGSTFPFFFSYQSQYVGSPKKLQKFSFSHNQRYQLSFFRLFINIKSTFTQAIRHSTDDQTRQF